MATTRYVKKNASGSWDVLQEGHRRSAVREDTKTKAIARARELVRGDGGGEVRVINRTGKIVDSDTVNVPSSRRRTRR